MAKANYISRHILKIIVLALLLAFLLYIAFIWSNTVIRQKLPIQYPEYVEAASEEFGLDKYLVYAIISTESGFDPAAQSSKGAVGLMQLLPETAQWITEKYDLDCDPAALTDPETNIRIGCCYFSYLLSRFEAARTWPLPPTTAEREMCASGCRIPNILPTAKRFMPFPIKRPPNIFQR